MLANMAMKNGNEDTCLLLLLAVGPLGNTSRALVAAESSNAQVVLQGVADSAGADVGVLEVAVVVIVINMRSYPHSRAALDIRETSSFPGHGYVL